MSARSWPLLFPILALCVLAPARGSLAAGGEEPTWDLGVGIEATDRYVFYVNHYDYGYYSYDEQLRTRDGWAATVSATRALRDRLQLRGDFRYLRYDDEYPLGVSRLTSYSGARAGRRLAEVPSLALGLRVNASKGAGSQRGGMFFEVLPAVYLASWTEEFDYGGGRVNEYHMTKVAPGFTLGAGLTLSPTARYHLEVGPRYLWSGDIGWAVDRSRIGAGQGLSEFTLGARIVRSL